MTGRFTEKTKAELLIVIDWFYDNGQIEALRAMCKRLAIGAEELIEWRTKYGTAGNR